MQDIILDFTGCRYMLELHNIVKEKFDFPEWYGNNLDALWDCMRDYCGYNRCVYIKGIKSLPKEFKGYMDKILKIFERVHTENPTIVFTIVS